MKLDLDLQRPLYDQSPPLLWDLGPATHSTYVGKKELKAPCPSAQASCLEPKSKTGLACASLPLANLLLYYSGSLRNVLGAAGNTPNCSETVVSERL